MPFQMIAGLANSGVNIANGIMNYLSQQDTNLKNEQLLRESWRRDDTAFSRAYNDITSKGFSPLATLGQSFGNTNPMSLEAPQLSMDLSSAAGAIGASADRLLSKRTAKAQQETAQRVADAQINNLDADTRDKNASADVNEATTAVQVLKAKAELDTMIANNNISTAQIVKYLNDMKSEGISDNVIDSLLSQFQGSPTTPAISAAELSGNKLTDATISKLQSDKNLVDDYHSLQATISSEYNLESNKKLRSALGEAQKLSADYESKLKELDYNNQNATWTVEVPVMTDSGVARMQKLTGKPYEIVHKYSIYFENYAHAKQDRDWINDPTESNGVVKSIKSFLSLFKDWL